MFEFAIPINSVKAHFAVGWVKLGTEHLGYSMSNSHAVKFLRNSAGTLLQHFFQEAGKIF
jgi:hypothetical protein